MAVDSAIISLLELDPAESSLFRVGGGSFANTSKLTTKKKDGTETHYFVKSGQGKEAEAMFQGEHESLNAIHYAVPTLCPESYGYGPFHDSKGRYFLVTDFVDLSRRVGSSNSGMSMAQKLAKLHTTPAPIPDGYDSPQFGFPATTCCGSTPQDNTYSSSWAEFYANRRLRFIKNECKKSNGPDEALEDLIEKTCVSVVPRLLGDDHLNGGNGITPVVVHGDLWSGNASRGKLPGMSEPEDVVYDSSACYAHSEFELGIMKMFGGFGSGFLKEYHQLVPKTKPVDEYEDRVALYELYHHLNHHALFGGGYRSGAVSIMKSLISKYGEKEKGDL